MRVSTRSAARGSIFFATTRNYQNWRQLKLSPIFSFLRSKCSQLSAFYCLSKPLSLPVFLKRSTPMQFVFEFRGLQTFRLHKVAGRRPGCVMRPDASDLPRAKPQLSDVKRLRNFIEKRRRFEPTHERREAIVVVLSAKKCRRTV